MTTLFEVLAVVLMLFSFWGWGRMVTRFKKHHVPHLVNIPIGVAILNVIGGWVVFFGLMGSVMAFGLLAVGLLIAANAFRQTLNGDGFETCRRIGLRDALVRYGPWILVIGYGSWLFFAYHDCRIYNYHDDFEKYLKYPVQLMDAGHLRTGLYDSIGIEALGAQSFFQSFFLLFGGVTFIPAWDAVLCQIILLIFLFGVIQHPVVRVLAGLFIVAMDPLVLNVSAIYSGALAYGVFLYGMVLFFSESRAEKNDDSVQHLLIMGLGIGLVVTLKLSLALTVPLYFAVFLLFSFQTFGVLKTVRYGCWVVGSSVLFALPWFLIQYPKARVFLSNTLHGYVADPSLQMVEKKLFAGDVLWFQFGDYLYGHHCHILNYTVVFYLLGGIALIAFCSKRMRSLLVFKGTMVALVATVFSYLWLMGMFASMMGQPHAVRYSVSLFIAVIIPVALLFDEGLRMSEMGMNSKSRMRVPRVVFGLHCVFAIAVAVFVPSLFQRVLNTIQGKSHIAIPEFSEPFYRGFCDWTLGESQRNYMQGVQSLVPEDKKIMVWCIGAFQLDYARNEIWGVDPAGMTAPWTVLPHESKLQDGMEMLRQQGIEYIYWQYKGLGVRDFEVDFDRFYPLDQRFFVVSGRFTGFLEALIKDEQVEVVYEDKSFRLLKI